ncbi:chromosome segregation protein SMC [Syntrophobotulus glycolicus DSM 8271]|uniref:Chromosome partition protein Smc n=2 Tax=Syntrophobotulus TaxID=51196 RepID=F0SUE9_SYNGF|nr:chromosome segregation protein SMC [Syntrophobotulus glycolicus DSM 8271]
MTAMRDTCIFLKALHIQGFKSFADKLKLEFGAGMCVIVGPNGSGKSNVADAVRWVLGEQSVKSLRGSKMEDVIFSGSSARRPVGMAEVSLVFDNSAGTLPLDFQEVTITRRVYRDGESQYYINRSLCRLRDIQELFLDTGSGKEGFSIIGQGRIDEILNLKSDERRLLIEEVAGISKYRMRKKEALKKLEDTQKNLERLNDIIVEIEGRLEPLKEQAETARLSKELNQELAQTEISVLVCELEQVKNRLQEILDGAEEMQEKKALVLAKIAEHESIHLVKEHDLEKLKQTIQQRQEEIRELENAAQEETHQISILTERQGFISEQKDRLEKEMIADKAEKELCKDRTGELAGRKRELTRSLEEMKDSLAEHEQKLAELRTIVAGSEMNTIKAEIFEEISARSKYSNEVLELENRRQEYVRHQSGYLQEKEKKAGERAEVLAEIEELTGLDEKMAARLAALAEEISSIDRAEKEKSQERISLNEQKNALQRKTDGKQARLNALSVLEKNMEGYHRGVREAIFAWKNGKIKDCGVLGTVADVISVDKKYEIAIETALGGALQDIIVEKTEDAKKCIAYLKASDKGRATFLPLETIRGGKYSLNPQLAGNRGFHGLAVELIRYDGKYSEVMESLLGRIIVAENLDCAVELAQKTGHKVRVVTLQGDQVNPGGSLTGGSSRSANNGLIGRPREIEDLKKEAIEIQREMEALTEQILTLDREIKTLVQAEDQLETEQKEISEKRHIQAADKKYLEQKQQQLEKEEKLLDYQLTELEHNLENLNAQSKVAAAALEGAESSLIQLQAKQAEAESLIQEKNKEANDLNEVMTSSKVETARWEQELSQTEKQMKEEQGRLEAFAQNILKKAGEMANIELQLKEVQSKILETEGKRKEINEAFESKEFALIGLRRDREHHGEKLLALETELKRIRQEAGDLEQQVHQNELKNARWEAEWETGIQRLRQEYSLEWEDTKPYLTTEKKEALTEKTAELKRQITELGPVNYTALDEYPETLERYEFMSDQRNDLTEAGETLNKLIIELNENMTERFQEGFKSVNRGFQEVFAELFHGGSAELILDDPDNILETGVKIIARPPGKKAQLLSLLSGGERALTAIALLFAFLRVKPSPFCFLDEIEAALDEANVKRFVEYLRTLSASTQFILVSHRRGTMEAADRLFGITMEESGVSKLLTVEMDDTNGRSIIA